MEDNKLMNTILAVVMCGDPGQVGNASRQVDVFQYGASVNYSCNTGFILLSGDVRRMCLADGNWDGVQPVCQGMFLIQLLVMVCLYGRCLEITLCVRLSLYHSLW